MVAEGQYISSCKEVVKAVKTKLGMTLTNTYVADQMKSMGLKYQKVKHISWQGNSEKSLVLRQRWAISFLE